MDHHKHNGAIIHGAGLTRSTAVETGNTVSAVISIIATTIITPWGV